VTNMATSTGNGGQAENTTTVLAMAIAALYMDESSLVAGRMQLTYFLMICLSYCIVPVSLIFTLITWRWGWAYPFSHSTCAAHHRKKAKHRATSKFKYVRRKRRPRIMCRNTRWKASYANQMGQNSAQIQNGCIQVCQQSTLPQ